MFRVAEFEKKGGRQVFKRFAVSGYRLGQKGQLRHYKRPIETKDRRKKNFVELNRATGQTDVKGKGIFENDLIHDKEENQICRVEYCEKYAAFVAVASILNFSFPLTFLDKRNQKFEVVGNIYEGLKGGLK